MYIYLLLTKGNILNYCWNEETKIKEIYKLVREAKGRKVINAHHQCR